MIRAPALLQCPYDPSLGQRLTDVPCPLRLLAIDAGAELGAKRGENLVAQMIEPTQVRLAELPEIGGVDGRDHGVTSVLPLSCLEPGPQLVGDPHDRRDVDRFAPVGHRSRVLAFECGPHTVATLVHQLLCHRSPGLGQ